MPHGPRHSYIFIQILLRDRHNITKLIDVRVGWLINIAELRRSLDPKNNSSIL